ncbi:dienelactone hydrolase [Rhizobium sp. BR 317]|uniref:alpha/beta hydrolase family protein n=1 Tax=Rhizobium sp. BR 317 TaxID=3040015 RepID=UPI0039BF27B1
MRAKAFFTTVWLAIMSCSAHSAGLATMTVPADERGPALQAFVWTPCRVEASSISFGPVVVTGVKGCPIEGSSLPLIVISHGHAGSALGHHDTAETLADAGFIVVALNHPGDNYADLRQAGDISAMVERPTDIRRLIDFVLAKSSYGSKIDPHKIGFFGFSRGGYTGLVLAGARPDFRDPSVPCPEPAPICGEIRRNELPTQPLTEDKRIKVFALADPLSFFPTKQSLQAVEKPIQLWASEYGGDGVLPQNVAALAANLPTKPDYHSVPEAAHFAFLAPCSKALTASEPAICTDGRSFDRAAFHQEFNSQISTFFKRYLHG